MTASGCSTVGKVRFMSSGVLERTFDIDAYVERIDRLVAEAERDGT